MGAGLVVEVPAMRKIRSRITFGGKCLSACGNEFQRGWGHAESNDSGRVHRNMCRNGNKCKLITATFSSLELSRVQAQMLGGVGEAGTQARPAILPPLSPGVANFRWATTAFTVIAAAHCHLFIFLFISAAVALRGWWLRMGKAT